ncbi:hypothetical protein Dimus_022657, partial [Dionaea muscipula]
IYCCYASVLCSSLQLLLPIFPKVKLDPSLPRGEVVKLRPLRRPPLLQVFNPFTGAYTSSTPSSARTTRISSLETKTKAARMLLGHFMPVCNLSAAAWKPAEVAAGWRWDASGMMVGSPHEDSGN